MNKYLAIATADLKNTRRDPTLILLFWVPVLILLVVRFGIPALSEYVPLIADYYSEIIVFFTLLNSVFPGIVLALIILDEKDQLLLPAMKSTPVSLKGFLTVRITMLVLFGSCGSMLILFFNGIDQFPAVQVLALSFLCALNVPLLILLIITRAKNKVEGLTLIKVVNIILFIPIAIYYIHSPWENIFAIFPAFWVYRFFEAESYRWIIFITGVVVLTNLNYFAFRYANKTL